MINYKSIPHNHDEIWICVVMNDTIDKHSSAEELIEEINKARRRMESECLLALRAMNITPSNDASIFGFRDVIGHRGIGECFYRGHNYSDSGIRAGVEVMARTLTNRN